MQNYTWILDKDHIADPGAKPGTNGNAVGMFGPRDYRPDLLKALMQGGGIPFRMLDDDKNLYYEGRIAVPKGEEDGEALLYPLDDFGMPNAGCTIIQYKDKTGKWKGIN